LFEFKSDARMDRISAAGNLSIEVKPESWRLIVNGDTQERVLVEAAPGQPLRYIPTFAAKRRLPNTGILPVESIQRVVLGWSNDDEAWHLGLLLSPELANLRGSRWCEIARWPDPDFNVFGELASQAGRSLARTITRPFNLIEPQPGAKAEAEPVMPPLRALPLEFDQWTLEKTGDSLRFLRAPQWSRSRVLRVIWYALLAVVYVVLSLTTLSQIIALPRPEFLPYLGLAVAALLGLMILYLFYQLFTVPDRVTVDGSTQSIYASRGNRERWRLENVAVESIYVSQVVNRRGKKRVVHHGELNVRLQDGSFFELLSQPQSYDDLLTPVDADEDEAVVSLNTLNAYTDLQMAAIWVAQTLRVPCWYDRRTK
jgi:hypothetical protein